MFFSSLLSYFLIKSREHGLHICVVEITSYDKETIYVFILLSAGAVMQPARS